MAWRRNFIRSFLRKRNDPIQSSEIVVRFNDIKNFGRGFGRRTDILVLINRGRPSIRLSQRQKISPLKTQMVGELWFSRPKEDLYFDKEDALLEDRSEEILTYQSLLGRQVKYINNDQYRQLLNLTGDAEPSSGLCALFMCLNDSRFRDHHIYLTGFSWTGWEGHNWEAEKAYCLHLEEHGKLSIL